MGIGFVLLIWGIIGTFLASATAGWLTGIVDFVDRRRGRVHPRWRQIAARLPLASVAYMAVAFVVYGVYCGAVRHVDPGIGDDFWVPLANGYQFEAVDMPEQASIKAPDGQELHSALRRIGTTEDLIVGQDEDGFFIIDTERQTDRAVSSESDARAALSSEASHHLQLLTPTDFYLKHRRGVADIVAALLIVMPPFVAFLVLAQRFWRSTSIHLVF